MRCPACGTWYRLGAAVPADPSDPDAPTGYYNGGSGRVVIRRGTQRATMTVAEWDALVEAIDAEIDAANGDR